MDFSNIARVGNIDFDRPDPALIDRFRAIPAANVGDAQDRLGVMDSRIQSVWAGGRICGPAFTVLARPGDNLALHAALTMVRPGDVLVVAGGADEQRALIGELIGGRAKAAGVEGFVIDGGVRDAEGLAEYGMPVFARAVTPAGPYKSGPGKLLVPVAVGAVAVLPGDLVVADADGIVIVPRADLHRIADRGEEIRNNEDKKRELIGRELEVARA